jgi:hypothetical protein
MYGLNLVLWCRLAQEAHIKEGEVRRLSRTWDWATMTNAFVTVMFIKEMAHIMEKCKGKHAINIKM